MDPKVELALRITNTVCAGLLAYGVVVASWAFSGDHEQRQRTNTMHLYDEWRDLFDFTEVRFTLEKIHDNPHFFDDGHLERLSGPQSEDSSAEEFDEILEQRQHIIATLNLLEQIAVAADTNMGDREIIRDLFCEAMQAHYDRLQPFLTKWGELQRGSWRPLVKYLEEEKCRSTVLESTND